MSKGHTQTFINYEIDIDNIREQDLPFVDVALLTNHSETEPLDNFTPYHYYRYYDYWEIYGDGELLYKYQSIPPTGISAYPAWQGFGTANCEWYYNTEAEPEEWIQNTEDWNDPDFTIRCKYGLRWTIIRGNLYKPLWSKVLSPDYFNEIQWHDMDNYEYSYYVSGDIGGGTVYGKLPYGNSISGFVTLPYDEIKILRYPYRLTINATGALGVDSPINKTWIKLSDNKYKLRIYIWISRLTERAIYDTHEYDVYEDIFNSTQFTYQVQVDDDPITYQTHYVTTYTKTHESHSKQNIFLYSPQETPINLRLLVKYVNKKGVYEIRELKRQNP